MGEELALGVLYLRAEKHLKAYDSKESGRQGFTAYSPLEKIEAIIRATHFDINEENWGSPFLLSAEQVKRPGVIDFCSIEFFTLEEITKEVQNALRTKNVKTPVAVYIAGASLNKFTTYFNYC